MEACSANNPDYCSYGTYVDQTTGYWELDNIPAGNWTLYFGEDSTQNSDGSTTYWGYQFWGNKPAAAEATVFALTAGQDLTGMNMTLSPGGSLTVNFAVQGSPKVNLQYALTAGLQPDEGSNITYADGMDSSLKSMSIDGDGNYSVQFVGLPTNSYKVAVEGPDTGPYPLDLVFSNGTYTDPNDPQGPFVPVQAPANVAVGATNVNEPTNAILWDPSPAEFQGGPNPSSSICGCDRADPVSTADGEFDESSTDAQLGGAGPAVEIQRSYASSRTGTVGVFGAGWTSLLDSTLVQSSSNGLPTMQWTQEDGSGVTFYKDSTTGLYAASGHLHSTLSLNSTTHVWTVLRRNRTSFTYNSAGVLLSESDLNGNTIQFGTNSAGQISSETASGGRQFSFTYNSSGQIGSVSDSAGRSVTYSYDTNKNLVSVTGVRGDVQGYGYDGNHNMTTLTSPRGGVTTNTFDSQNRVVTQVDPLNRTTTFAYGGSPDSTTTTTTPDGGVTTDTYLATGVLVNTSTQNTNVNTTYNYDGHFNVASTVDGNNNTTTYTHDTDGNVLTATDPLGSVTTTTYNALDKALSSTQVVHISGVAQSRQTVNTYDSNGNHLTTTDPTGDVQKWTYNTNGTPSTMVNAKGGTTTYQYDPQGLVTGSTDPDGVTTTQTRNAAGAVLTSADTSNDTTTYTLDANERVLTAVDALQRKTTYAYDGDGNLTSVQDPTGATTTYSWDLADEKTAVKDALGRTRTYGYTLTIAGSKLASETDPLAYQTTWQYGYAGDMLILTDPLGNITRYSYDADHNLLSTQLPSGKTASTTYDGDNHKTQSLDYASNATTYKYDEAGELFSSTDPKQRTTTSTFNADGQQTSTTVPDGGKTQYAYDADGNVTSRTDADSKVTTWTYDTADRRSTQTLPGQTKSSFTYDSDGRISTTTNPDGSVVTDTYDAASEPKTVHYSQSGATNTAYTYDGAGRVLTMVDATGTTTRAYDADGELTSERNGAGASIGYGYDAGGDLTSIVYPGSHTLTYAYDKDRRMTSLKDWSSHTTTFTWSTDSLLTKQADPNALSQSLTYDSDNRLTASTTASSSQTLAKYSYGYDAASERTSATTVDPTTTGTTRTYAYDGESQLASGTTGSTKTPYTASQAGVLSADAAGTLTSNSADEVTKLTPASGAATTYTYNANGARLTSTVAASGSTAAATTTYTYAPNMALASAALPSSGGTVSYTSDGTGLRQTRTLGSTTTKYTWANQSNLPMLLDDGTTSYVYGPNGHVVEEMTDSTQTPVYTFTDAIGSVRLITSAAGASTGTYNYDAYGTPTHASTATSTLEFAGQLFDSSTTLLYLRTRDFDAKTSQFTSVDSLIALTDQMYTYAGNNPLSLIDPSGRSALSTGLGIAGTVVGGIGLALTLTGVGAVAGVPLDGIAVGLDLASTGLAVGATAIDCGATHEAVDDVSCTADALGFVPGIGGLASDSLRATRALSPAADAVLGGVSQASQVLSLGIGSFSAGYGVAELTGGANAVGPNAVGPLNIQPGAGSQTC